MEEKKTGKVRERSEQCLLLSNELSANIRRGTPVSSPLFGESFGRVCRPKLFFFRCCHFFFLAFSSPYRLFRLFRPLLSLVFSCLLISNTAPCLNSTARCRTPVAETNGSEEVDEIWGRAFGTNGLDLFFPSTSRSACRLLN